MKNLKFLMFALVLFLVLPFCGKKENAKKLPVDLKLEFNPPQPKDAYILKMKYSWTAKPGFSLGDDYWVYVHFWDLHSKSMYLVDDHKPPVEFSRWRPGEEISYERVLVLPEYIEDIRGDSFPVNLSIGFYNPGTGDKIEVLRKNLKIKINPEILPQKIYAEGWYGEETDSSGRTWRWMSRVAVCRVENPRKVSFLYLEGFFPTRFLPDQKLRVFVNDKLLAEITEPTFKKLYEISPEMMGDGDEFILRFEAEKSFVPAQVSKDSTDKRELAVAFYKVFFCVK